MLVETVQYYDENRRQPVYVLQLDASKAFHRVSYNSRLFNVMRSPVIERLMVRDSQVALKHVIHDMESRTLVMELRRRAIKRWVLCGDMDRRLKIPHSAKAECGFRTTPEECLYDSGPIGSSV